MKKFSLISKIIIALILGVSVGLICKSLSIVFPMRILTTFSSLFGNFLSFIIPLIIIGFIVPGVASLGNKSGKTLLLTIVLAYTSTLIAGFLTFIIGFNLLPKFINGGILLEQGTVDLTPYFTIDIPPMINIMSALVFAFILGVGLSRIKNSTLLKIFEEFSSIVEMVIKNVLIPLVPFYIFNICKTKL